MVSTPPCRPRCGGRRLIQFGVVAGQHRWRCKRCRYQFTGLDGHGTPEPTKRVAVTLYGYGLPFNTVAHLLGTTVQSVLRWVCSYVDHHCSKFDSDRCGVYPLVLAVGAHYQGKGETVALECNNG